MSYPSLLAAFGPSATEPVRLVQMWVLPDVRGGEPGYQEVDISDELSGGGLVKVASGLPGAPISIRQRGAALWAGHLAPGSSVAVPQAEHVHVFIATGTADLAGTTLHEGDAARLTNEGEHTLAVAPDGAGVLIWATS